MMVDRDEEVSHLQERPREILEADRLEHSLSKRDAARDQLDGLTVIENSSEEIHVSVHAADRYTKVTEAASVKLRLESSGECTQAGVAQFAEADFAKGTAARRQALSHAEALARERGATSLRFERDQADLESLSPRERQSLLVALGENGFDVTWSEGQGDKERRGTGGWVRSPDDEVAAADIVRIEASKDLTDGTGQTLEVLQREGNRFKLELTEAVDVNRPPERMHLPSNVSKSIEVMWERSVREEQDAPHPVREYGALVVEDRTQSCAVAHVTKGTENRVALPEPSEAETLIGYVHTHPYESKLTDMSFSGADFAVFMGDDDARVSIVRSGDSVFALVKSGKTPQIRGSLQQQEIADGIDADYERTARRLAEERFRGRPTFADLQNAALVAGIRGAKRYRLHLYYGEAGEPLEKVS